MRARGSSALQRAQGSGGIRLSFSLLLIFASAACATPRIAWEELPEAPIAFVYRTSEEGRRLADLLDPNRDGRREYDTPLERYSVLELGKLGEVFGAPEERLAELHHLSGRMAMLVPVSQEFTLVDAALRGARPLAFSRDRERLLFMSQRERRPQIFELSLSSQEVRPRSQGPAAHPLADYGPKDRLVFAEVRPGPDGIRARIVAMAADGGGERVVSEGPLDSDPTWSPDGAWIVFVRRLSKNELAIAVAPAEGGEARIIARGGMDPVFTPDGAWIVYSAQTPLGRRLWRMRPDGSGKLPLGDGMYEERNPAVSPDGAFVAFVAEVEGHQRLYVRRFNGTGDRLLLEDGDGTYPVW